jgi:hypothetical protein
MSLLKRSVLRAAGLIDDKPPDKPSSCPDRSAESSVAANCAEDRADAGPRGGAGEGTLLGWGHVGTGDDRQSKNGDEQNLFHGIPFLASRDSSAR